MPETPTEQVARERKEIEDAPPVVSGPPVGRCSFCGRLARTLTPAHDRGAQGEVVNERYKGECCA